MEYDWRSRFGLSVESIGRAMPVDEAARLVRIIRADPSSMIAAVAEGWEYPISRSEVVALDTYDLLAAANSNPKKRPKPHPLRPWKHGKNEERHGNAGGRSRAEVVAILNAHGHALPV